jgi:xylulose-5-phosphate/fructose-6-phosphate phosphoketolase
VEAMAAAKLLNRDVPQLKVRFVNVCDLMVLDTERHIGGLTDSEFEAIFTKDKPVVFNFHGYPSAVHQLLFKRPNSSRFFIVSCGNNFLLKFRYRMATLKKEQQQHLLEC